MVRQGKSSTPTRFVWNTNIAAAPLLAVGKLIWPPFQVLEDQYGRRFIILEHQNGNGFISLEY